MNSFTFFLSQFYDKSDLIKLFSQHFAMGRVESINVSLLFRRLGEIRQPNALKLTAKVKVASVDEGTKAVKQV